MPKEALVQPGDILTIGFEDFNNRDWVQRLSEKHTTALVSTFTIGAVRILVESIKPDGEMEVKAVLSPGLEMEGTIKIVNPDIEYTVYRRVKEHMLSSYGVRERKKALIPLRSSKRIDLTWSFADMLAIIGGPELDWRELDLSDSSLDTMQVYSGNWEQPFLEIDYGTLDPKPDPVVVITRRRLQKFIDHHSKEQNKGSRHRFWNSYEALHDEFILQYTYLLSNHEEQSLANLYANTLNDKALAGLRSIHRLCASQLELLDVYTEIYITLFENQFKFGESLMRQLSGSWSHDKDLLPDTNRTDKFLDFLDILFRLCNNEEIPTEYRAHYPKLYADVASLREFLQSDTDGSAIKMMGGNRQSRDNFKRDMLTFMLKFKYLCHGMDAIRQAANEQGSIEQPHGPKMPTIPGHSVIEKPGL